MLLIIVMTNLNELDNIRSVLLWSVFSSWFGAFNGNDLGGLFKELKHNCICVKLYVLKFKMLVHVAGDNWE